MKALILVGGFGTRLRPLTLSVPKPLISFCNKSIIEHQVEALARAGVTHVILAVARSADVLIDALQKLQELYSIKISFSVEDKPMGTAGPLRLAEDYLMVPDDVDNPDGFENESFFVFNSDVICDYPIEEMKRFHLSHGGEGTLLVTKVADPSKYGVVLSDPTTHQINSFVEKPTNYVGDSINAGIYLLKKKLIKRIEKKPTSIEKEVFPVIAKEGGLYCQMLKGYWADIGQPLDYLNGMSLYLNALAKRNLHDIHEAENHIKSPLRYLANGHHIVGNVLIDSTTEIGNGCLIGPNVTIAKGCTIGDGVRIQNSAIMDRVKIGNFAFIDNSIVGWQSTIGQWVRMDGITVVGEDVHINDTCYINGAFILPHKVIDSSITESGKIIM